MLLKTVGWHTGKLCWAGGLGALLLSLSVSLSAQAIRGRLFGQLNGQPITGALVLLIDQTDHQIDQTLTDGTGRFLLSARSQGAYSLLVLRIGYEKWHSEVFPLTRSDTLDYNAYAQEKAFELPAVTVEARRQCLLAPEAGKAVAALWGEASKALRLTKFTREHIAFEYRIARSTRRLNPSLVTVEEEADTTLLTAFQPFTTPAPDSLVATGFVQDSGGMMIYYGPDVEVLFSDAFLGHHCFKVTGAGSTHSDLVGLSFEPTPDATLPDIRGVMWLDRTSAKLKYVEYQYTNLEADLSDRAEGRIEFLGLPSGAWIVRRWWIQVPIRFRSKWALPARAHSRDYRVQERRVLEVMTLDGHKIRECCDQE